MDELPVEIYPVAGVQEIDRIAIEDEGIAGYTLMTRAGSAAVDAARRHFPEAQVWQVVCGAGNNAGDGYVVARLARAQGIAVSVIALVDPAKLTGDAARAHADYVDEGGAVEPWDGNLDSDAELLVDGLLGSGLTRAVEGEFARAVDAINAHPARVLALDIPTGVHGDSGAEMGIAVRADLTVTFVGLKQGLFLGAGIAHTGELEYSGLDVPAACRTKVEPVLRRMDEAGFRRYLPRRARDAHKGDFGHLLVVGGGPGMPGALRLCGEAALRTGAGRVSLATHPSHAAAVVATRPELMSHAIDEPAALEPLLEKADVIAFGPGLGRSVWARNLYDLVAASSLPSVWDADALNLLAESPSRDDDRVLTPHPGEAGRLSDCSAGDVQADRLGTLDELTARYGGTAVLKGAGTLISASAGPPWLCTAGNPGMASPGMGDVLTGIIAALIAQGLAPGDAARIGVEAHGRAGDRAADGRERGMIATDLLDELRDVLNP